MTVRLLIEHHLEFLSLKGGCIGSSESTLVKIPNCWKSYDMAHLDKEERAGCLALIVSLMSCDCGSSSLSRGMVCSMLMQCSLIILTYFFYARCYLHFIFFLSIPTLNLSVYNSYRGPCWFHKSENHGC